ncbi:MAG: class I SAM-dependent methyltransferase [Nitrosarchaeum sp.]
MQKRFLKEGIGLIFHNPRVIPSLFTFDFHRIYCSYFKQKLKESKKRYQKSNNENILLDKIGMINNEILKKHSRNEAYFVSLYFLIRELEPETVIETGVHRGVSSLFILQALHDNNKGKLLSIDLPLAEYTTDSNVSTKSILPTKKVGICIPEYLKKRWELVLGDSKKELPRVLKKINSLEVFLHDSKHTYEHMMWEFKTVWPYLNAKGVLIADDTNWNESFKDFCSEMKVNSLHLRRDKTSAGTFSILIKN